MDENLYIYVQDFYDAIFVGVLLFMGRCRRVYVEAIHSIIVPALQTRLGEYCKHDSVEYWVPINPFGADADFSHHR